MIAPPFDCETALAKVQAAEDAWNTRDPDHVVQAYSPDSRWRDRHRFLTGHDEIRTFLADKWNRELDYRLNKELWAFTDDRISVRFEYEWHDHTGQWFRTHGNEHWEFDATGLMKRRDMSANDIPVDAADLRISPAHH
ncbi:MAG: nuclear transport factor 2 family protein [Acidimicrobiales bacterium]